MTGVVLDGGDVQVDVAIIAAGLRLATAQVRPLMQQGRITSRLERGMDDDAGRYRLTFLHRRRQLQLVIDESGQILEQSTTSRTAGR